MQARAFLAWLPFAGVVVLVGFILRAWLRPETPITLLLPLLGLATVVRFVLLAGGACWVYYGPMRDWVGAPQIQQAWPTRQQMKRELAWSVSTALVFTAMAGVVFVAARAGVTRILTTPPDAMEGLRLPLTVGAMLVVHDGYFYALHRFLHWGPLYRLAHQVHHRSTHPTPFAAFAFHPVEAVLEAGILPLLAFLLPWRPLDLGLFALASLSLNVLGHLGHEVFKPGWASHPLLGWLNSSTHHNMHHQYVRGHYGLYSNVWDRCFGTQRPDYLDRFSQVHGGAQEARLTSRSIPG